MKTHLAMLTLAAAGLSACDPTPEPMEITYASYEDCILAKVGRGQSKVASAALIEACRVKYPETSPFQDLVPADGPSFGGFRCTDDCSGHEAGYEWAAEEGIEDPADCRGYEQSFEEGCEVWTRR